MMENSTILIVDDNQEIREIIEILLTGEGFQAVQAKDGMTALELLKEREFDLIILDIMMPGDERLSDVSGNPQNEQCADLVFERQNKGQRQDAGIFQAAETIIFRNRFLIMNC